MLYANASYNNRVNFRVTIKSRPVSSPMSPADFKKAFHEINVFHRQKLMRYMTSLKGSLILQYDQNFKQTQKKLQNFKQALVNFESNLQEAQTPPESDSSIEVVSL